MSMYFTEPESADPGRLRSNEDLEQPEPYRCDSCGVTLHWTDNRGTGPIRLVGLGAFCSARCVDDAVERHAHAMRRFA